MTAITTRRRTASGDVEQLAERVDRLEKALVERDRVIARFAANVAAVRARAGWTDFKQLHRDQYNGTPADIELLADILAGRKP